VDAIRFVSARDFFSICCRRRRSSSSQSRRRERGDIFIFIVRVKRVQAKRGRDARLSHSFFYLACFVCVRAFLCFKYEHLEDIKTNKEETFYFKTRGRKHLHAIQFTVFTNITTYFSLSLSFSIATYTPRTFIID
jgi:hypothetical protein